MKAGIIIAFGYGLCEEVMKIQSIVLDIFLAYKWCKTAGCEKIILITDCDVNEIINYKILNMIIMGEVDPDINFFMDRLNKEKCIYRYTSDIHLRKVLMKTSENVKRLLLYYSGHAEQGMALLPRYRHRATYVTKDPIEIIKIDLGDLFRSAILATARECKIIVILDCCDSNAMNLPYALEVKVDNTIINKNTIWSPELLDKIIKGKYLLDVERMHIYSGNGGKYIICLSPSLQFGESWSTNIGSEFSIKLFNIIENAHVNTFTELLFILIYSWRNIDNVQPNIYSSYPDAFIIQPWIRNIDTTHIEYNPITLSFEVV